jgi:saxitoxin biosynthesis operon SxtJ-like protein
MAASVSARLSHNKSRRFGLVVGTAFLVLGALAWWRGRQESAQVLGGIGALLILLGAIVPGALTPVFRAWMGAATVLSRITTPILLALIYFAVLTPIGVLRRLAGKGRISSPSIRDSFWVPRREQRQRREHLERQF